MTGSRFAAHIRRRGVWIAGGVLAVLLVPYITAFVSLRRTYGASFLVPHPELGAVTRTHRFHAFPGGTKVSPLLYRAFTPIHRWCLGGMTHEEFSSLSSAEMRENQHDVYLSQDWLYR